MVIGGLFAAWASEKMLGALSGLAGVELPIERHVNAIAAGVLLFVFVRIVVETVVVHNFSERLETVTNEGELESENLQVGLSLIIRSPLLFHLDLVLGIDLGPLRRCGGVLLAAHPLALREPEDPEERIRHEMEAERAAQLDADHRPRDRAQPSAQSLRPQRLTRRDAGVHHPAAPNSRPWALELFEQEESDEEEGTTGSAASRRRGRCTVRRRSCSSTEPDHRDR